MLQGKKIIVGISASIAAYKTILLVRLLIKLGAEVRVLMTRASLEFVSPLVLATFSKHAVWIDFHKENVWNNHVELGIWGDVFVVAPASCNTLSKMATGLCDNIVLATYLSARCPIIIAPAMDEDMFHHPSTQSNITKLRSFGHHVMDVGEGFLASGLSGEGRMAEPDEIVHYLMQIFRGSMLKGKRILISAGPTQEAIDPVRYISNHSSGKMGMALAEACYLQGAHVCVVAGPMTIKPRFSEIDVISVVSAADMEKACLREFSAADWCIMSAAVADFRPQIIATEKIKKQDVDLQIQLEKTTDILAKLGQMKNAHQLLIGFALETQDEEINAIKKLVNKQLDYIVLNSLRSPGAGFSTDTNQVIVFSAKEERFEIGLAPKEDVAKAIVSLVSRV